MIFCKLTNKFKKQKNIIVPLSKKKLHRLSLAATYFELSRHSCAQIQILRPNEAIHHKLQAG